MKLPSVLSEFVARLEGVADQMERAASTMRKAVDNITAQPPAAGEPQQPQPEPQPSGPVRYEGYKPEQENKHRVSAKMPVPAFPPSQHVYHHPGHYM